MIAILQSIIRKSRLIELDAAICMTRRKSDLDMWIDPTWFHPCPALSYKAFYIMKYTVRFALILSCKVYVSPCVVTIVGPSRSCKNS